MSDVRFRRERSSRASIVAFRLPSCGASKPSLLRTQAATSDSIGHGSHANVPIRIWRRSAQRRRRPRSCGCPSELGAFRDAASVRLARSLSRRRRWRRVAQRSGYPGAAQPDRRIADARATWAFDIRRKAARTSVHCGRTNKLYFSRIARLESGAVEVSSLWRPAAKLRPLPLLPAWIERSNS